MQAIFKPWRDSMVSTKVLACSSDSGVPVSSQAKPRLKRSVTGDRALSLSQAIASLRKMLELNSTAVRPMKAAEAA